MPTVYSYPVKLTIADLIRAEKHMLTDPICSNAHFYPKLHAIYSLIFSLQMLSLLKGFQKYWDRSPCPTPPLVNLLLNMMSLVCCVLNLFQPP